MNETFATMTDSFSVVCECGDIECMEQITLAPDEYRRIRASPHRFIVKRGHEAPDLERPIEDHAAYVVVEKHGGLPARIAEETDPPKEPPPRV